MLIPMLVIVPLLAFGQTEQAESIDDALLYGTPHFSLRYRYEHVEDDRFGQDADASTMRLRLNYRTGTWRAWSAFTELDYVGELFVNDFNSGAGTSSLSRNQFPVVADPKGADLNQLYLDYGGIADARIRVGRQRILLDDQRFVGGVGWRQNEQTYDGISGLYKTSPNLELFYAYLSQVNRIFGDRSIVGSVDTNTHLLNAKIGLGKQWLLVPFYYYIDNDIAASSSTETVGLRASGKTEFGASKISLLATYAAQSSITNNPINYDADYYHVLLAWVPPVKGLSLEFGIEALGGDQLNPGQSFRTPLATLHAFQGWADQFLATPDAGLSDRYVRAEYQFGDWSVQGAYHDFEAEDGAAKWGNELNLSANKKLNDRFSLLLKLAVFNATDPRFADVNKAWFQIVANY